jgi:hypothetical protein
MRITLDLNDQQVKAVKDILEVSLASLALQEAQLLDALEVKDNTTDNIGKLNKYLTQMVVPQRIICAEILATIKKADPDTRIIVPNS